MRSRTTEGFAGLRIGDPLRGAKRCVHRGLEPALLFRLPQPNMNRYLGLRFRLGLNARNLGPCYDHKQPGCQSSTSTS